jgi:hypothetical protein
VNVADSVAYYDYEAAGNITAIRRQGPLSAAVPVNRAASWQASDAAASPDSTVLPQASAR